MEQINGGMLEMLKYVAASQMYSQKVTDPSAAGESEFGKLLEKKNSEVTSESASDKNEPERAESDGNEVVKSEKPKSEQEDEMPCDVAREVACSQIVWMTPQINTEEQIADQTMIGIEETAVIGEVVNMDAMTSALTEMGEEVVIPEEMQLTEVVDGMAEESLAVAETGLAPEQTVEVVEETAAGELENTTETVETEVFESVAAEKDEAVEGDATGGEVVVTEAPLFKDVETAPIKVAEAPAQTEAPELETQVSDKLVQILENGENRVTIQLQPEALGKMTIELTQNVNGTLSIVLNAENAQTRGMLEKHIGTMQEVLADRGQQNVQIEVSRGEETQRQTNQQQDLQDGGNGNHNEQQRRRQENSGEDFLQQLRLGLIDMQEEF